MRHSFLTIAMLLPTSAFAQTVIDYDNTSYLQDISPSISKEYADDIHRVSSAPVSGLDFRYISHVADYLDLYLTVYRYDSFLGPPPPSALLATYLFPGLPSDGEYMQHLDLPSPLAAPRDIWIGFRFVLATHDVIQMRLGGLPTVGSSTDGFAASIDNDPALDAILDTGAALENFFLTVYAVPEPTTIACFAIALCLFADRRLSHFFQRAVRPGQTSATRSLSP